MQKIELLGGPNDGMKVPMRIDPVLGVPNEVSVAKRSEPGKIAVYRIEIHGSHAFARFLRMAEKESYEATRAVHGRTVTNAKGDPPDVWEPIPDRLVMNYVATFSLGFAAGGVFSEIIRFMLGGK